MSLSVNVRLSGSGNALPLPGGEVTTIGRAIAGRARRY